jgi:hypothetical protein
MQHLGLAGNPFGVRIIIWERLVLEILDDLRCPWRSRFFDGSYDGAGGGDPFSLVMSRAADGLLFLPRRICFNFSWHRRWLG